MTKKISMLKNCRVLIFLICLNNMNNQNNMNRWELQTKFTTSENLLMEVSVHTYIHLFNRIMMHALTFTQVEAQHNRWMYIDEGDCYMCNLILSVHGKENLIWNSNLYPNLIPLLDHVMWFWRHFKDCFTKKLDY